MKLLMELRLASKIEANEVKTIKWKDSQVTIRKEKVYKQSHKD